MSVREKISEKPSIGVGLGIGMVVLAVASLAYTGRDQSAKPPEEAFFTTDDGKTYFAASIDNCPPFQHEGKTAVRAFVFECKGVKSVHYLQRYTEPGASGSSMLNQRGRPPYANATGGDRRNRPRAERRAGSGPRLRCR